MGTETGDQSRAPVHFAFQVLTVCGSSLLVLTVFLALNLRVLVLSVSLTHHLTRTSSEYRVSSDAGIEGATCEGSVNCR